MPPKADRRADYHSVTSVGTRLDPAEDRRFRERVGRLPSMTISKAVTAAIREWLDRNETTNGPEGEK